MNGLLGISRLIDDVVGRIGKLVAWAIFAAVFVSTVNALVRYAFNYSSNAFLEAQWYLFGAVFMLCAGWTLRDQEHIRIDILSGPLGPKFRSFMDLVGVLLFLFPFCLIMIAHGFPFFYESIVHSEGSASAGGLPQWPAKILIPLGFVVLFVQGVSELIKRIAVISGHLPEYLKGGGHGSAPEAEEHGA